MEQCYGEFAERLGVIVYRTPNPRLMRQRLDRATRLWRGRGLDAQLLGRLRQDAEEILHVDDPGLGNVMT